MKLRCGKCNVILQVKVETLKKENPKVKCPKCKVINNVPLNLINKDSTVKNNDNNEEVGWIVVHDENTTEQVYPLFIGINTIGRKSVSKPCNVMIETNDKYMSRNHCCIEVIKNRRGQYDYIVFEKNATNGTFINASIDKKLSQQDQIYLKDGNTIQMGHTKVVLKTKEMVLTIDEAQKTVINTDYNKTIIL